MPREGTYALGDTLDCSSRPTTTPPRRLAARWWIKRLAMDAVPVADSVQVYCVQPLGAGTRLFLDFLPGTLRFPPGSYLINLKLHTLTSIPGDAGAVVTQANIPITVIGLRSGSFAWSLHARFDRGEHSRRRVLLTQPR